MSLGTVLSTIGHDAKKVFLWLASPQGQAVVATGESVLVDVDPALAGIVALINKYVQEAFKVEALAAAAGQQSGSGAQKAAAVMAAVEPAVLQYAKEAGLPTPTADQIKAATDAVVAFLNAFSAPAKG